MNKKIMKIKSRLHVSGTDEADASVSQDLNVPDPESAKAKAILDKAIEKENDDEEEAEENINTVDEESRADSSENSES